MLVTPVRRHSKPYLPYTAAVIALQPASALAALGLPGVNTRCTGASSPDNAAGRTTAVRS